MPRASVAPPSAPAPEPEKDYWELYLKPPYTGQTRMEYFYDGAILTSNGVCRIPKTHPDWASRLVKMENYGFVGYKAGDFPDDFVRAITGERNV